MAAQLILKKLALQPASPSHAILLDKLNPACSSKKHLTPSLHKKPQSQTGIGVFSLKSDVE
jgi:hypothetical protein